MVNQCLPYDILKRLKVNIEKTLTVDNGYGADMLVDGVMNL